MISHRAFPEIGCLRRDQTKRGAERKQIFPVFHPVEQDQDCVLQNPGKLIPQIIEIQCQRFPIEEGGFRPDAQLFRKRFHQAVNHHVIFDDDAVRLDALQFRHTKGSDIPAVFVTGNKTPSLPKSFFVIGHFPLFERENQRRSVFVKIIMKKIVLNVCGFSRIQKSGIQIGINLFHTCR